MIIDPIYFLIFALAIALLEIEIEGKYGWAEKTATWYSKKGFFTKIFSFFMAGKPCTGYHLYLNLILWMSLYMPFFFGGVSWSLGKELVVFAVMALLVVVWDFLWFIYNPEYTIKNFKKENIWWFKENTWIFNLFPLDYLKIVSYSFVFSGLAVIFGERAALINNLWLVVSSLILIGFSIILAPFYHRFLISLRSKDERSTSGIFHKELFLKSKKQLDADLKELKDEEEKALASTR